MTRDHRARWYRAGLLIIKGVAVLVVSGGLLLAPVGGSSTSSELLLSPYLPRTAHQAYGYTLAQARLSRPPARDWLLSSERAIFSPANTDLPLDAQGRFDSGQPDALGLRFTARSGQRVYIEVETEPDGSPEEASVFVDLFAADSVQPQLIESSPPSRPTASGAIHRRLELAVLEPSGYVLRVQPTLGYSGDYRVSVRTAPLLAFPVEGMDTRAIQSGFGAERDGGARAHRGVDIFAPRGTSALAAMDSWVSRVETTTRGGNVVWLQPLFGNMRLYYAHLDTQLVQPGDFVLAGEAVGTVGNTGNAITTPPHLHFGVYLRRRGMRGGARDPYPFLD